MADACNALAIRSLVTPNGQWTPVVVPIDCSQFVIRCISASIALAFRTDKSDSTTEVAIAAAGSLSVVSSAPVACFQNGTTVGYLNCASGSGPATIIFVR